LCRATAAGQAARDGPPPTPRAPPLAVIVRRGALALSLRDPAAVAARELPPPRPPQDPRGAAPRAAPPADGRDRPPDATSLKASAAPSRFPTLSNTWELAEWGSTVHLEPGLLGDAHGARRRLRPPRREAPDEKSSSASSTPSSTMTPDQEHVALPLGVHSPADGGPRDPPPRKPVRLGLVHGISIAGNDLIASVFYTLGLCATFAGAYSPISLLLVSAAIYPLRNIITEIATALPFNGGTYNIMLNTTTKILAAAIGSLSILDYVATAVVSAATAMGYLASEVSYFTGGQTVLPTFWLTLGVMVLIAGILFLGLRESALVATVIFTVHLVTMAVLMAAGVYRWFLVGNAQLVANWSLEPTGADALRRIFAGFCVGLLGVTGYECAENYIEEMDPATFGRLMNIMWWIVTVFNAPMSLITLALLPVDTHPDGLLSQMGEVASGSRWLRIWVTVDAVVVLCAGVLAGFIGAAGLLNRMATDHLLPQVFRRRNRLTGSQHVLIASFLVLCCTLYAVTGGDITSLSGVFAMSFLSAMCGFAVCNVLLKYKRGRLPRTTRVSLATALVGFVVLFAGLVGNVVINPEIVQYFLLYFA
ncbi:MAG: amino acid permease-domain-containing protein, partial [Olpidium bornovanus]